MESQVTTQEHTEKKLSCLAMITAPKQQIAQIKDNPLYLTTLLVFTGLTTALILLSNYVGLSDPQTLKELLAQHPGETASSLTQKTLLTSGILGLVATALTSLFGAGVGLLIVKGLRGKASFQQLFSLQTHLYLLVIASLLIETSITLITGNLSAVPQLSLAALIPVQGVAQTVLAAIEPFNIWAIILYSFGLQQIAGLAPAKAWTGTGIFFLLGLGLSIGITALV